MKKIVVFVTALAAMTPAAFAQTAGQLTEAEAAEVMTYVPDADLSNLTVEQATAISGALSSGDNVASQINTILAVKTVPDPALVDPDSGMLTEAELAKAKTFAPDADFSNLTSDQANAISAALTSGDNVASQINTILMAEAAPAATPGMLTEAEMAEVLTYVPDADLSNLTAEQANAISAALASGENVASQITTILG